MVKERLDFLNSSCDIPDNECYHKNHYIKQISLTDMLSLKEQYPEIKKIVKTSVCISVCSTKTICNPIGSKIVVCAVKHIKIKYIPCDSCNKICYAKFTVPFCAFIPIKNVKLKFQKVNIFIENISTTCVDSKVIGVSIVISMWPVFKYRHIRRYNKHLQSDFCGDEKPLEDNTCENDNSYDDICDNEKPLEDHTCSNDNSKCNDDDYYYGCYKNNCCNNDNEINWNAGKNFSSFDNNGYIVNKTPTLFHIVLIIFLAYILWNNQLN